LPRRHDGIVDDESGACPGSPRAAGLSLSRIPSWRMVLRRLDERAADGRRQTRAPGRRDAAAGAWLSRWPPGCRTPASAFTRSASTGNFVGQQPPMASRASARSDGDRGAGGPGRRYSKTQPFGSGAAKRRSAQPVLIDGEQLAGLPSRIRSWCPTMSSAGRSRWPVPAALEAAAETSGRHPVRVAGGRTT